MGKMKEAYYVLYRFVKDVKGLPDEIKWKLQRMQRGYSDRDVWNLSSHVSKIIAGGVAQLNKNKNGTPVVYGKEYTEAEWSAVLDVISYTFNICDKVSENDVVIAETADEYRRYTSQGFAVLTLKEKARYELGWELFKKHYYHLWD